MTMSQACDLCSQDGGEVLWRNEMLRVVLVDDAQYPGFCRIIWNGHVREMTDLPENRRDQLMQAVWRVETAVRSVMQPDKINVASLGNVVPHLHWHVIPRYHDDAHFPAPVWAAKQRETDAATLAARHAKLSALRAELLHAFTKSPSP
jgi:diadenosine tetraphosphate (Ap4A) HIT family hydrolase